MLTLPFLWGAQYYRAPTPSSDCWERDLKNMKALGFNAVKYWAQWRWSHRAENRWVYDDLDRLMDLAADNGLAVTINVIFDVAPTWLFRQYPDAKMVTASGEIIEPRTEGHRQIGGSPGPCYHHPQALAARQAFLRTTVDRYRNHPAMSMWDVWNEPEQGWPYRKPEAAHMLCYCKNCRERFVGYLQQKYPSIDALNDCWGRCYDSWSDVETPLVPATIRDMIDWREFHLDKMTAEANWRLAMVEERDPKHTRYLHVVPNTMSCFNSITGVDDFDIAKNCQVFAATMNQGPAFTSQVVSAGWNKVCYNVESHIDFGSTSMHQRTLGLNDLLNELLPQIGWGVKGFLFWQYRAERLGAESPAWGVVRPDGSPRPITDAICTFGQVFGPHMDKLMGCRPTPPRIGIWKSRKNELFHFCIHSHLQTLIDSVEGYLGALYNQSYPFRIISGQQLEAGDLAGIDLLILPSPYYVTEAEARALDAFVNAGGTVLTEAHLAAYNGTDGRHSATVPGCGLDQAWGLREAESTSSFHLKLDHSEQFDGPIADDVKKALAAGTTGGHYFPIRCGDGTILWGASRYAVLAGEKLSELGRFNDAGPTIVSKNIGRGRIVYVGANLGEAAKRDDRGLREFLRRIATQVGITPTLGSVSTDAAVHVDVLSDGAQTPKYVVVFNRTNEPQTLTLNAITIDGQIPACQCFAMSGTWRGLFTGQTWTPADPSPRTLPGHFAEVFVIDAGK